MNYEQISDFEINKAVAEAKGLRIHSNQSRFDTLRDDGIIAQCWLTGRWIEFDYCNNPADAWPVINDNRISLINEGDEWSALANASVGSGWDVSFDHVCWHTNPLRAAMIVFLMMQEAK